MGLTVRYVKWKIFWSAIARCSEPVALSFESSYARVARVVPTPGILLVFLRLALAVQKTLHLLLGLPGWPCVSLGLRLRTLALALAASSPRGPLLIIYLVESSRSLYIICERDCHVRAV